MNFFKQKTNPSDIVWLQTGFLGDIVLTTAAIDLAKKCFPGVRQHLITTKIGKDALGGDSRLYSVIVFEKNKNSEISFLKSFSAVKKEVLANLSDKEKTVVLQTHRSFRSSFLSKYIGLPVVTYFETDFSFLADQRVSRIAIFHEAARIALLFEPLGIKREDILGAKPRMEPLSLDGGEEWKKEIFSFKKRIIAIAPGSVWGTKRWVPAGFCELVVKILETYPDINIVLLGSKNEAEEAGMIESFALKHKERIWNLAGKTSLADLRGIFPRFSLLVSNDSSPVHYASAFNVPTVAIFGATIPAMGFEPLADKSKSLGIDLDCRPCSLHGPMKCPKKHFRCMNDLSVDVVFKACAEILAKK